MRFVSIVFSTAMLVLLYVPAASAGTNDYTCSSGYTMKGSTSGLGAVYCFKAGSETTRNNRPVCGIKRYKEDGSGNTDICTKTNGTKTGYPNCIGGTKSVRKGADRCVNKTSGKTTKPK